LPPDDDTEALKDTGLWRVIYGYFPFLLYAIFLLLHLTIVKEDSIKFLLSKRRYDEARIAVCRMYKEASDERGQTLVMERLEKTFGKDSSGLTFKDAMVNPQYRTATWVNIGYMIFHELTGNNVILLYSNILFASMNQSGLSSISPREGTYLVGIANTVASIISIQVLRTFGRKSLVVVGHILMALSHITIGIMNNNQHDNGVIIMILVFVFFYQNTSGPVAWLYAAETAIDSGMGIILFTLWITVFALTLISPIIMSPESLGPSPVFFMFGVLSMFGALYCYIVLKETKGLTDKEKKSLFLPKRYRIA